MGLILSKKHGINPCLTICSRCGKETPEILLLGNAQEYECNGCGGKTIGKSPKGKCPHCGHQTFFKRIGAFDGSDRKLPASELCEDCKKEIEFFTQEIEKGGVPWKCTDCKSEGIIKHDAQFAIDFRKQYPTEGFSFSKNNCPVCKGEHGEN
jgi:DNA-directed RNA polymerase subunit RPC12/RpoP